MAYRRHADVRRSANDWSIVTRRFSLRPSLPSALPCSLSLSPSPLLPANVIYTRVCRSSPLLERASPPPGHAFQPSGQPIRSSSNRSSRVDLFTFLLETGGEMADVRYITRYKLVIPCSNRKKKERGTIDKIKLKSSRAVLIFWQRGRRLKIIRIGDIFLLIFGIKLCIDNRPFLNF